MRLVQKLLGGCCACQSSNVLFVEEFVAFSMIVVIVQVAIKGVVDPVIGAPSSLRPPLELFVCYNFPMISKSVPFLD